MSTDLIEQRSYNDGLVDTKSSIPTLNKDDFIHEIITEGAKQDKSVFKVLHSKLKTAVVLRAYVDEHISSLTEMNFYIKTIDNINVKDILGTPISLEISYDAKNGYSNKGERKRYFSGSIVSASFEVVPVIKDGAIVKSNILCVRAMSTFAKCHYTKKYETFIKKKPDSLIKNILKECGVSDVKMQVSPGKEKMLITQYDETNLEFVSRMMEENGYFYFFKHENGKDTINIVDKNAGCPSISTKLVALKTTGKDDFDNVFNIAYVQSALSKEVELKSYDVKTAKVVTSNAKNNNAKTGKVSIFDIAFDTKSDGDKIAKLEVERHSALEKYIRADCLCCEVGAGFICKIDGSEDMNCNGDFLIVGASHVMEMSSDGGIFYKNSFVAIKKDIVFRPQRMHKKPVKHGSYIATVVDKDGKRNKDIDIDDDCMILIEFPFGLTSRVRYTNISANNKFGSNCIPRPGAEVLVIFANGDIDNPIVIGSLYNGSNNLHNDCKSKEITSLTTKTIDGNGYNQVIFDDKKDKERIQFRAQRDWIVIAAKGDMKEILEEGSKITEFKNEDKETKNVLKIKKGDNVLYLEEGDSITSIKKGDMCFEVEEGDSTLELKKGDYSVKIGNGEIKIVAKKKILIHSEDCIDIQSKKDISIQSEGKLSLSAKKDVVLQSNANIQCSAKQKIQCKANQDFGIEGMNLKFNGKMNISMEAKVQLKVASTMVNIEAKAMLGLKGAVVNVG